MARWPGIVALMALAGCSTPAPDPVEVEAASIAAPSWAVGDWWTYRSAAGSVTWVVTEDLGDAWMVDIDDAEWAFGHAAFAQISTVGRVGKADLAGSQESGPVRFFSFPLTENKTWTLTWDAIPFTATVVDVVDGTAEVRAEAATGEVRVYVYDNATRWFPSVSAYDADGGLEFEVETERSGATYAGTYARWTIHGMHGYTMAPGDHLFDEFPVPDEATDIWYRWEVTCHPDGVEGDQGVGLFEVHPAEGEGGISVHHVCPGQAGAVGTLEAHPPSWGVTGLSAGITLDALLVPRTLTVASLA